MDDAKLERLIPGGVEGVAVRRFGYAIGAVDWAANYLFKKDNYTGWQNRTVLPKIVMLYKLFEG